DQSCEMAASVVDRELPRTLRDRLDGALRDVAVPNLAVRVDHILDDALRTWSTAYDASCESPARAAGLGGELGELRLALADASGARGRPLVELPLDRGGWTAELVSCPAHTGSREYRHAMASAMRLWRQDRAKDAIGAADAAIAAARDPHSTLRAKLRRLVV